MVDDKLLGRIERRLPIIVPVGLVSAQGVDTEEEEKTFTDNISPHGLRVFSKRPWQAGHALKLSSLHDGSVCGRVVYCQKLSDDRYALGLHVPDHAIPWPVMQRFWET